MGKRQKGKKYRFQWAPCRGQKVTRSREYRKKRYSGTPKGPPVDRLSSLKVIPGRWLLRRQGGTETETTREARMGPYGRLWIEACTNLVYEPSVRRSPIYLCVNKAIRRRKRDYSSLSPQIGLCREAVGIDSVGMPNIWMDRRSFRRERVLEAFYEGYGKITSRLWQ